jgi:hypothetical protein
MAEDKKGFLLYADLIHTIEKMPSEKAGDLFKHILRYVNDLKPISNDLIIDLTFEPIKQQLKRDLIKFEKSKDEKSLSGRVGNLKRWNIDLYNKFISKELTIEEAENIVISRKVSQPDKVQSQTVANIAVNDNVNVNVNVNDIKEVLNVRKLKFSENLKPFLEKYSKDMLNDFYLYWTEHGEKDKKMKFEKQTSFGLSQRLAYWNKNDFKPKQQNKIDNPHGLSLAQLESNRIAKLNIEEAIKQKAIDKELDRLDEIRRKQQNL